MDRSWYRNLKKDDEMAFHLDIFDIQHKDFAESNTYPLILCDDSSYIYKFLRGFKIDVGKIYFEKELSVVDDKIFTFTDKYLIGYWQTEQYFYNIKDSIRQDFKFIGKWDHRNSGYKSDMESSNSVSIHVRRGDYLKQKRTFGGICTEEYYRNAINYIRSQTNDVKWFVFSNDLLWCRQFFSGLDKVIFVEGNTGESSYMDMILMQHCRHHIIANSSFSWWGAWLSQRTDGITVSPHKWLNSSATRDVWAKGWIKI